MGSVLVMSHIIVFIILKHFSFLAANDLEKEFQLPTTADIGAPGESLKLKEIIRRLEVKFN